MAAASENHFEPPAAAGGTAPEAYDAATGTAADTASDGRPSPRLTGEIVPAPRRAITIALLGATGILLFAGLARLFARWVLLLKRPGELALDAGAITIRARTELLGRTLREYEIVIPRGGLARITREVRYPAFGLYAGLLALATGSYFGVALTVDGVRAASASMLGLGLAVMALGVAIDFVLTSVLPGRAGRCRLVVTPRRGRVIALGLVEAREADELLALLRDGANDPPELRKPSPETPGEPPSEALTNLSPDAEPAVESAATNQGTAR